MKLSHFSLIVLLCSFTLGHLNAADPKHEKPIAPEGQAFKNVRPEEFDQLRQKGTNVVLDVRTKKEYQEGHIPGSILIDYNSPDFDKEIARLDKNKTYLVHCAAGGRSSNACKKMSKMDFKNLYNLEGGMRAWAKEGKPVEKVK
jgi:phage shock protein E